MREILDNWKKLPRISFEKLAVRIYLTLALVPDTDVSAKLGQRKSISYIMSHDCSHCVKDVLLWKKRGRSENRWATIAVQVRHNGCVEGGC